MAGIRDALHPLRHEPPQQDVLLLSTLTTLGATLADLLCFFYGTAA